MPPVEYDVFLCCREPSGTPLARLVSAGLAARGFRVCLENRLSGSGPDARRLALIADTPDFVLLLTPGALDPCVDEPDPMRQEIAHALKTGRDVVQVYGPGFVRPQGASVPPELAQLAGGQGMAYDPDRSHESIARLAHSLSSDTTVDDRRLERKAKRISLAVGVTLLALIALKIAPALPRMLTRPVDARPLPPLALYWSGFGQRLDNGRWAEFPLVDGSPMSGGDQFRLIFSSSADGFAYVVSKDVRGEITVLFPPRALRGASPVRAGGHYAAPDGNGWFTVDGQAGVATIYVMASYDSIDNIEELVEDADRDLRVQDRGELLETTLAGLLDGRHGSTTQRIRTRSGRPIEKGLAVFAGDLTASATLASGAVVTHALVAQPGLLSAVVEIRIGLERTRQQ